MANGPKLSIIPAAVVYDDRVQAAAFRVLAALGIYADKNECCFPSLRTIAEGLDVTCQAVHAQIRNLERTGLIEITPQYRKDGSQTASLYRFLSRQPDRDGGSPDVDAASTPEIDTLSTSDVDPKTTHLTAPKRT